MDAREEIEKNLLPCPFCGGRAGIGTQYESNVHEHFHFVNCQDCLASTDQLNGDANRYTMEEAAELWNHRTL